MDKQIRKPRIGDVAKRAGVSTATVSRTLATPDRVTPKTRDAVMRAVRETGYVLNLAARNLRTSRTHAVLAVLPDASNTFFSQVLRGISDTLHRHGYSLVIADTANDPERERDHAGFIQGGRVDGVLLLNGRLLPSLAAKRGHQVPTVSLCERIPGSRLPHVETANRDAALFTDPDRFDIDRSNAQRHLGFATGTHSCLGFNLAKAQARIALQVLLSERRDLELIQDSPAPQGYEFHQPRSMYVRLR